MTAEETGPKRQPGDIIGDYRLVELISRGAGTRTWRAEQVSIQRPVMLELLKRDWAQDVAVRDAFLADVRAKAAINHPVIGHVYEAQSDELGTYLAREVLDGTSLEEHHEAGKKFSPREVASQIESIAGAFLHLEQQGVATVGLAPHHLILNDQTKEIRLMNLSVHGEITLGQDVQDKVLLGELYDDLLVRGEPGSVRGASLLDYMADTSRPQALTWDQINRLANQVRTELTDTQTLEQVVAEEKKAARSRSRSANTWALLGGFGLILALLYFFVSGNDEEPTPEPVVDEPVELAPVELVTSDGILKFGAHEVTIAQYQDFLTALERLPDGSKDYYSEESQPKTKTNHLPNGWKEMLRAAQEKSSWSGRTMNMNCPVVGIDFWDATAYAKWAKSRLPTAAEWFLAASRDTPAEGISDWGDATASTKDRTGNGLIGMAGNVAEWTSSIERNPAFPLDSKQPIVCGGSFQAPASGAQTQAYLKSRETRRDDLGFRVLSVR